MFWRHKSHRKITDVTIALDEGLASARRAMMVIRSITFGGEAKRLPVLVVP